MGYLNKAVSNALWVGSNSVLSAVASLAISSLTVRFLGLDKSGLAISVLSIAAIISSLGGFGMSSSVIYFFSLRKTKDEFERAKKTIESSLFIALVVGILGGIAISLLNGTIVNTPPAGIVAYDIKVFCVLTGFSFAISQLGSPYQAALEGLLRYDLRTRVILFSLVYQVCATVFFLSLWKSLLALGLINVTTAIFRTCAMCCVSSKTIGFWACPKWSNENFHYVYRYSKWIYIGSLFGLGFSGFDRLIIINLFTSSVLPIYVVSRRFYETIHEVLSNQTVYFVPLMRSISTEDVGAGEELNDRLSWFVAALAGWLYAALILIGPLFLKFSISEQFAAAASMPLLIFSIVGFLHALAIVPYYSAQADGCPEWGFSLNASCAASVPVAMWFFGKALGFNGSVAGQMMIGLMSASFVGLYGLRRMKVPLFKNYSPSIRPAVIFLLAISAYFFWMMKILSADFLAFLGFLFLIVYFPFLFRVEGVCSLRVLTLRRAIMVVQARSGFFAPLLQFFVRSIFGREEFMKIKSVT